MTRHGFGLVQALLLMVAVWVVFHYLLLAIETSVQA